MAEDDVGSVPFPMAELHEPNHAAAPATTHYNRDDGDQITCPPRCFQVLSKFPPPPKGRTPGTIINKILQVTKTSVVTAEIEKLNSNPPELILTMGVWKHPRGTCPRRS
uniref:(northern house mosquito) hypothetical protein n=1 Tax=Culex pipiens TaxID=7175 RepID=A0A8D8I813_CULPI